MYESVTRDWEDYIWAATDDFEGGREYALIELKPSGMFSSIVAYVGEEGNMVEFADEDDDAVFIYRPLVCYGVEGMSPQEGDYAILPRHLFEYLELGGQPGFFVDSEIEGDFIHEQAGKGVWFFFIPPATLDLKRMQFARLSRGEPCEPEFTAWFCERLSRIVGKEIGDLVVVYGGPPRGL